MHTFLCPHTCMCTFVCMGILICPQAKRELKALLDCFWVCCICVSCMPWRVWQEPGVDDFYKVVLGRWGKLLPDLSKAPTLLVIDLTTASPGTQVKRSIDDVIKVEDDDDEKLEEQEFKALPEDNLSVEEIQEKIEYLRCPACTYQHT